MIEPGQRIIFAARVAEALGEGFDGLLCCSIAVIGIGIDHLAVLVGDSQHRTLVVRMVIIGGDAVSFRYKRLILDECARAIPLISN
jgi:hypothetical protein